ncbi:MAG: Mur ligase family protein [Actinomycetota bacterium]|nr:Mur ligase family protein [Actinomycetota bacterium]
MGWTIQEALAWLDGHDNFETKGAFVKEPSLEPVATLIEALGISPSEFRTIHVTGTNGKGSVSRICTELLVRMGQKVGTFLSPHLDRVNERILLGGLPVSDDLLASELLLVAGMEEQLGLSLSWFEVLTAAALSLFYAEGVEAAVIEVGIGGTWDSTNVIDGDVAVVTSVGHDHLELLGPGLEGVAENKAGIIKPASVVVLGAIPEELVGYFRSRPSRGVLRLGHDVAASDQTLGVGGWRFDLRTPRTIYQELFVALHGRHQVDNAAVAIAAVEALAESSLDYDTVAGALAGVSVPGRAEVIYRNPLVVADGAHNAEAAEALARTMAEEFAGIEPVYGVAAMLAGKDARAVIKPMKPRLTGIFVTTVGEQRSMSAAALGAAALEEGCSVLEAATVEEAVSEAMEMAGEEGAVVVFGSFRTAARARRFLLS